MTACAAHPEAAAAGACTRCGQFYCSAEAVTVDAQAFCAACGQRDDVDEVGAWLRDREGRRTALVYLGLGAGLLLCLAAASGSKSLLVRAGLMANGLVFVLLFFRVRAARLGAVLCSAGLLVMAIPVRAEAVRPPLTSLVSLALAAFGEPIARGALLLAFATWVATDVGTRVFLGAAIERSSLRRFLQRNPMAVNGLVASFLGVFVPPLALVGLTMGVVALVKSAATPRLPVGGGAAALGAIVLAGFTIVAWASMLVRVALRFWS